MADDYKKNNFSSDGQGKSMTNNQDNGDLLPPIAPPSFISSTDESQHNPIKKINEFVPKKSNFSFKAENRRSEDNKEDNKFGKSKDGANTDREDNWRWRDEGLEANTSNQLKTTEGQKVEEEKLRKMIANEYLDAKELLKKIGERFDGRLSTEQIKNLVQAVQKREYLYLKNIIGNQNLACDWLLIRIAQAEINEQQRKELIEVLQNREEVRIRDKMSNNMINSFYLLEQINKAQLNDAQRKDLIQAVQRREEELMNAYIESQYMNTHKLLNMIAERADGRLATTQRQRLIERIQKREEQKLRKMVENPYIESGELLKAITLRDDGRLSVVQIKELISLVRQRV